MWLALRELLLLFCGLCDSDEQMTTSFRRGRPQISSITEMTKISIYSHSIFIYLFILTGKNWYANKIQGSVAICFVFLPSVGKMLIQEALMHIILINWLDCTLSTVCDLHVSVNKTSLFSNQSVVPLLWGVKADLNHTRH